MSVALESNVSNHRRFVHGTTYMPIYNSPDRRRFGKEDHVYPGKAKGLVEDRENDSGSESSSIGRNSDESLGGRSPGDVDDEVQSEFKGGALDSMDALEEVLPAKKTISNFYCGKSKSFTSLTDAASCSSIKDIVKPENAYSRRRKNFLAYNNFRDKSRNLPPRNDNCGISKRLTNCSKSSLALAIAMNSSEYSNNGEESNTKSSLSTLCLPPLPSYGRKSLKNEPSILPLSLSQWRSLSLSDLQCAVETSPITTGHNE